jgi:hypothetical protein
MAFSQGAQKTAILKERYHSGSFGVKYLVLFLVYSGQNLFIETSACEIKLKYIKYFALSLTLNRGAWIV